MKHENIHVKNKFYNHIYINDTLVIKFNIIMKKHSKMALSLKENQLNSFVIKTNYNTVDKYKLYYLLSFIIITKCEQYNLTKLNKYMYISFDYKNI